MECAEADVRAKASESEEAPKLEAQIKTLRTEQANLARAIAMAKSSIPALVTELERGQAQLASLEARLAVLKAAPTVLSLELTVCVPRGTLAMVNMSAYADLDA